MKKKLNTEDEGWMQLALRLAYQTKGETSPNPMVGAILVKNGKKLGEGFHKKAGGPHAEAVVLKKVKKAKGATLYVTLEPCCHTDKRTPPCVKAIIDAGIKRVVVGAVDPNPKVSGKGIRALQRVGIQVQAGLLSEECEGLNVFYNHWIQKKSPWVQLKMASSLDGRVALSNGKSKWLTSEKSRAYAHQLRSEVDAILVGIGTVLADNPKLNARTGKRVRQPRRIILDPHLKIPLKARVLSSKTGEAPWIVTSISRSKTSKAKRLEAKGVEIFPVPLGKNGSISLKPLLKKFGKREILSLLVEGGPYTWTQFIKQKAWHEVLLFIAPKFMGGDGRALLDSLDVKSLRAAPQLSLRYLDGFDSDMFIRYRS